ncbi:MAG: FHA domain-containing protein [Planctomycetaceae bacterium]|nr:FHA domain-containing protein [Planctomycetaceae bacterium]
MLTAELKVVGGRHHGRIIPLNTSKFLVGREQDCHLRPNSEMVSRHHCVFVLDDYTVRLRDLGSTNGTFVNNQRVRGIVTLKAGDLIRIGKLDLEILVNEPLSDDSATSPTETDTVRLSGGDTSLLPGLTDPHEAPIHGAGDTTVFMPAISPTQSPEPTQSVEEDSAVESDTSTPEAPQDAVPGSSEMPVFNPTLGAPGMPPQGYPQQPPMPGGYPQQYPPMNYPYGYQPGMPQYPQPGYPMMPGGYPGYNGYPPQQSGYGFPVPQQPVAVPEMEYEESPEPEMQSKVGNGRVEAPPVSLPDPSTTGAKDVVVGSDPSQPKPEETPKQSSASVPDAIDGILKQMTQRTPGR